MKKIFLLLFTLSIVSCTEEEQFVTFVESDITLFFDGSKQLTVSYSADEMKSKTYRYSSTDSTVVTVSSTGLVKGVSLGTAKVKITSLDGKYSDECNFTVSPKSTLYTEPNTSFGSSMALVKSVERRTLFKENATGLMYQDSDPDVRYVMYMFENNRLEYSGVLLTENTLVATEVVTFLMERYKYLGTSQQIYFFSDRKTNVSLGLAVDDDLGLCVLYMPPSNQKMPELMDAYMKMPEYLDTIDLMKGSPEVKSGIQGVLQKYLSIAMI